MSRSDKPKPQADKFRDLARELETDDDEKVFGEKVLAVAKARPQSRAIMPNVRVGLVRLGRVALAAYLVLSACFLAVCVHDGMGTLFPPYRTDWSQLGASLLSNAPIAGLLAAVLAGLYALGRGLLWALDGFSGQS